MAPFSLIKQVLKNYKLCFLAGLFFLLFSCKKKDADTGGYSEQFTDIFNNVNRLNDQKKPDNALKYLDSAFKQIKKPYVSDLFRYYGLKFIYHERVSHNTKTALLYADSMLMIAKKSVTNKQYVANYAEANFAKGDAYMNLSQFSNAYQCYYQGYFMGKNNLKNEILAEYTYRMGMVMFKQEHYAEAMPPIGFLKSCATVLRIRSFSWLFNLSSSSVTSRSVF